VPLLAVQTYRVTCADVQLTDVNQSVLQDEAVAYGITDGRIRTVRAINRGEQRVFSAASSEARLGISGAKTIGVIGNMTGRTASSIAAQNLPGTKKRGPEAALCPVRAGDTNEIYPRGERAAPGPRRFSRSLACCASRERG
jgi:hypothetical protein